MTKTGRTPHAIWLVPFWEIEQERFTVKWRTFQPKKLESFYKFLSVSNVLSECNLGYCVAVDPSVNVCEAASYQCDEPVIDYGEPFDSEILDNCKNPCNLKTYIMDQIQPQSSEEQLSFLKGKWKNKIRLGKSPAELFIYPQSFPVFKAVIWEEDMP